MSARTVDTILGGEDWSLAARPLEEDPGPVGEYPLASKGGIHAFTQVIIADEAWRQLTKPQRELLLSAAAGAPVAARADVRRRLVARGLLNDDLTTTAAGRLVIYWRLPPSKPRASEDEDVA